MKYALKPISLASLLLLIACNEPLVFEQYSSESGDFSIATPSAFEETQQTIDTPLGSINLYTYTAEENDSAYVVAYSDYPAEAVAQIDPEMLLNSSRDGALQNLNGTLRSEEPIELEGNPGRSLVIDATNATGDEAIINSRIYVVDNRLYQVLVVTPKGIENKADPAAFLDSFDLK